ncbi:MAG: transposase [Patescibacteria group bacterium]|nr:transposase [Patescibacteria group bacterium]
MQIYHVYNRGNRKRRIFYDRGDYLRFERLLRRYEKVIGVEQLGYCLMPNHYHLLVRCNKKEYLSSLMQKLGIAYTMYINKKYRYVGHVFQGRYCAKRIRSTERIIGYIRANPVEAGLVKKYYDYRWLRIYEDRI